MIYAARHWMMRAVICLAVFELFANPLPAVVPSVGPMPAVSGGQASEAISINKDLGSFWYMLVGFVFLVLFTPKDRGVSLRRSIRRVRSLRRIKARQTKALEDRQLACTSEWRVSDDAGVLTGVNGDAHSITEDNSPHPNER